MAIPEDTPAILSLWERSDIRVASRNLLPDPHWRWTELSEPRLREQIQAGQVRVAGNGFCLTATYDGEESEYNVHALVGNAEMVRALAHAARSEAGYRGYSRLEAIVADDAGLNMALEQAGYVRTSAMLIYEQTL